jgi:hypothetical protein
MILTPLLAQKLVKLMATSLKLVELFRETQKLKLLRYQLKALNVQDSSAKLKASSVSMNVMTLLKNRLNKQLL